MTPEPMDPTYLALGELLAYVYATSGVYAAPGSMSIRPVGDAWEVVVGETAIGTISREAILELAERIRLRRN